MSNKTMRAAVAHRGAKTFSLEDIPLPEIHEGEVLVRIKAAGLNIGTVQNWRTGLHGAGLPRPIGLHMAGEVVEVGRSVTLIKPGVAVRPDPVLSCGYCYACIQDELVRCPQGVLIGQSYKGDREALFERYKSGATATYIRIPESAALRKPDGVSFDVAAHIGTLAVSLSGLRKAALNFGETLIVNGASGANGAAVIKMAPLMGVGRVIAIARRRAPLQAIADSVPGLVDIIPLEELPEDWQGKKMLTQMIRDKTQGRGADGMVDFLPANADVAAQAMFALKRGGKAVMFGGMREDLKFSYVEAFPRGNVQIEGMNGHGRRDLLLLDGWFNAGKLDVESFVTHRFPLEKINDGLALLDAHTPHTWMVINP